MPFNPSNHLHPSILTPIDPTFRKISAPHNFDTKQYTFSRQEINSNSFHPWNSIRFNKQSTRKHSPSQYAMRRYALDSYRISCDGTRFDLPISFDGFEEDSLTNCSHNNQMLQNSVIPFNCDCRVFILILKALPRYNE